MRALQPVLALFAFWLAACAARSASTRAGDAGVALHASAKPADRAPPISSAIAASEGGDGGESRPKIGGPARAEGSSTPIDFASIPLASDLPDISPDDWAKERKGMLVAAVGLHSAWMALDEPNRSVEAAPVTWYQETQDLNGKTRAVSAQTVTAVDLVPGLIYAFRRCVAGCDPGGATSARREEVVLIGPRPLWTGSSAPTERQVDAATICRQRGVVSAPIAPGSSTSLLLVVGAESVAAFQRGPDAVTPVEAREFSLEIVWPKDATPQATLFSGAIDPPYRITTPDRRDHCQ
jgi:hypothetical protein